MKFVWKCLLAATLSGLATATEIIHDGEFNYIKAQHAKAWAEQDKRVDAKLAEIREANGGNPPNILYILVDDVGFGDFGIPELNYVRGTSTPNINTLADQGLSLIAHVHRAFVHANPRGNDDWTAPDSIRHGGSQSGLGGRRVVKK